MESIFLKKTEKTLSSDFFVTNLSWDIYEIFKNIYTFKTKYPLYELTMNSKKINSKVITLLEKVDWLMQINSSKSLDMDEIYWAQEIIDFDFKTPQTVDIEKINMLKNEIRYIIKKLSKNWIISNAVFSIKEIDISKTRPKDYIRYTLVFDTIKDMLYAQKILLINEKGIFFEKETYSSKTKDYKYIMNRHIINKIGVELQMRTLWSIVWNELIHDRIFKKKNKTLENHTNYIYRYRRSLNYIDIQEYRENSIYSNSSKDSDIPSPR